MKNIRYLFEYVFLKLFALLCSALPARTASNLGGWIGKAIGPIIGDSKGAKARIAACIDAIDTKQTYKNSWENLGRNLGEYPHLEEIARSHVIFEDEQHLQDILNMGKPLFFVSAHISNWELLPVFLYTSTGIRGNSLYREPNNPYVAKLLEKIRSLGGILNGVPKSKSGAKELISLMKEKEHIGFLFDQKFNEGDPIPFFGKEAMSYTSFIPLCQKYDYLIVPARVKRLANYQFSITLETPVETKDKTGKNREKEDVFLELNALLENWIKETPGAWLWQHKRWGKEEL